MHYWGPLLDGPSAASDVGPFTLLGPAQLFTPYIDSGIFPPLIGGATLFAPSVQLQGAANVSEYGRRVFAGAVVNEYGRRVFTAIDEYGRTWFGSEALSLYPPLLGLARVFDPSVMTQDISSPLRIGGASVIAPTTDLKIAPSTIGAAGVFPPGISFIITAPTLLGPVLLYDITQVDNFTIEPTLIGGAQMFSPEVYVSSVGPMTLIGGAQTFSPESVIVESTTALVTGSGSYVPVITLEGSYVLVVTKRGEFTA